VFGGTQSADHLSALHSLQAPLSFLHAEWAVGEGTPPAYPTSVVEDWRTRLPAMSTRLLPGLDHAGTVMTARGAAEVVRELRTMGAGAFRT
jgi:hypothetical protein